MLLLAGLLALMVQPSTANAAERELVLASNEFRLAAGGVVLLRTSGAAAAFPQGVESIRSVSQPDPGPAQLRVGVDARTGELFLAAPLTIEPGEYRVDFTVATKGGDEWAGVAKAAVDPLPEIAQSGRPPVILLNGYQINLLDPCPVSQHRDTFDRLGPLLQNEGSSFLYFDNCRECPSCNIEVLGNALRNFLDSLRYTDGRPVPEVDIVAHSMGGLIVRSYLAGKQLAAGDFRPPAVTKIRRAVFVGTPHFGSGLAPAAGAQSSAMQLGSRFLWDLSRWHQGADDLREIDAVAVAGSDGVASGTYGLGDGVVALTSAAATFALPAERTRVVPYCHVGPGFSQALLTCRGPAGIANVDSTQHLTYRIVQSFLRGTSDWRGVGLTPQTHPILSRRGGLAFAVQDSIGAIAREATGAICTTASNRTVRLDGPRDGLFWAESIEAGPARCSFILGGQVYTINVSIVAGGFTVMAAKLGPIVSLAVPAAGYTGTRSLAPRSLISIFGVGLAPSQQQATGFPWPDQLAGTVVGVNGRRVPINFVSPNQINAYIPEDAVGLIKLGVWTADGAHVVNVLVQDAIPAIFTMNGSGTGQAAAVDAVSGRRIGPGQPANSGDIVSVFSTGLGRTSFLGGLSWTDRWPTVLVDGKRAEVLYTGLAPGFLGLYQVNFRVPREPPSGRTVPLQIWMNGRPSNLVELSTQ